MFTINDDLSIYATRGDIVFFTVTAEENGTPYYFEAGDVLRIKIYGKKDASNVVLEKCFPVTAKTDRFTILLTEEDTKIGDVISKPTDYWYEIELNPFTNPQTIIGYDEDGAKVFKLFPEGKDSEVVDPDPEEIPVVDDVLLMTSTRPVQNQAIARAIVNLEAAFRVTKKEVTENVADYKSVLDAERARIDNLLSGATPDDAELLDIRVGAYGKTYGSAGAAVREQIKKNDNIVGLVAHPNYEDGKFVSWRNGTIGEAWNYSASNYIDVCEGFQYDIYSQNHDDESGYAFYDKDCNFICGEKLFTGLDENSVAMFGHKVVVAPVGAKYIRFSAYSATSGISVLRPYGMYDSIRGVNDKIENFIGASKKRYWENQVEPPYFAVLLDCGRKFFSVENVRSLIDLIKFAGFNQLTLHFSEDSGFRFALDDMTVTDEVGRSYDLTQCLGGYENPTAYYTQADMDEIIQYARTKGIDIVPSFNMPGHIDWLLAQFPKLKYPGTNNLDVTNEVSVSFAKAVVDKYSKYFASRGCHFWNIGSDEITMFGGINSCYESGNLGEIAKFANTIADVVKKNGLIPRVFNDVVYYKNDYRYTIDKDIEVCLWTLHDDNYAKPDDLQVCGYKVINTSSWFYWVLGRTNNGNSTQMSHIEKCDLLRNYNGFVSQYAGYGAMVGIWCDAATTDHPNDNGDYIISEISSFILAFSDPINRAMTV